MPKIRIYYNEIDMINTGYHSDGDCEEVSNENYYLDVEIDHETYISCVDDNNDIDLEEIWKHLKIKDHIDKYYCSAHNCICGISRNIYHAELV